MKQIPRFPGYFADKYGNVFRLLKSGQYRKIKPYRSNPNRNVNYLQVSLYRNKKKRTRLVHQLVLEAFVGEKPSPFHVTRHKNDISDDNRLHNLEWGIQAANIKDKNINNKLKITIIQKAVKLGLSLEEVSILCNIAVETIKTLL